MNVQPQEKPWISPEAYLESEKTSDSKSEYFNGETFAMTGASLSHNRINRNLIQKLGIQLEGSSCEAFASDMRVKIEAIEKYTYPDVSVVCGDVDLEKKQGLETLLNPIVIIEILSKSTEAYDRGKKFTHYRLIPSLQEYILVSQTHCQVETFLRGDDGGWKYFSEEDIKQSIKIESIDCELLLSNIYYRVAFQSDA